MSFDPKNFLNMHGAGTETNMHIMASEDLSQFMFYIADANDRGSMITFSRETMKSFVMLAESFGEQIFEKELFETEAAKDVVSAVEVVARKAKPKPKAKKVKPASKKKATKSKK